MKYIAKFKLKESNIRVDYRRTIISFFKAAIESYLDGQFYEQIYGSGAKKKGLVWAVKLPGAKFQAENIALKRPEIEMTMKFSDAEPALIYFSSMLSVKWRDFPIGNGNSMQLCSIKMAKERLITSNTAVFKFVSPLCLRQHDKEHNKDRYVAVGDQDFFTELKRKVEEDIPSAKEALKELQYDADGLKKIVVKAFGLAFNASIGSLVVKGDPMLLNEICKRGIGSKRNAGFGLVEAMDLEVME